MNFKGDSVHYRSRYILANARASLNVTSLYLYILSTIVFISSLNISFISVNCRFLHTPPSQFSERCGAGVSVRE